MTKEQTNTPTNTHSRSTSTSAAPPSLDNDPLASPLEDPPPYTLNPSFVAGESTLEHGPRRPFQSNPTPVYPPPAGPPPVQNTTGSSQLRPAASLLQTLNNSFNDFMTQLDNSQRKPPQPSWSAYPGQKPQSSIAPIHMEYSSPSTSVQPPAPASRPSSDFARDFYSAGTGENLGIPREVAQPPVPPAGWRPQLQPEPSSQTIGKPTAFPVAGHPLLRDGKLLVYPKNYRCDKCQNVGYKAADPSRPCKRCWSHYAKPFSGPLAYSFASLPDEGNFQRPLPAPLPPPPGPPPGPPSSNPPGGCGGPRAPPALTYQPTGSSLGCSSQAISQSGCRPPPGSVVYMAGDPRIGGALCWQCRGKGNVSFLFDRITCDNCGGIGRVFDM